MVLHKFCSLHLDLIVDPTGLGMLFSVCYTSYSKTRRISAERQMHMMDIRYMFALQAG